MRERILRYVRARSRDPSAWLALLFIATIGLGAAFGLSLTGYWNLLQGISISLALLEWAHLLHDRSSGRPLPDEPVVVLSPPTDRWKAAWMVPVSGLLLGVEVWMDQLLSGQSFLNFGLTALGVSTFVSLWYAWSLPVRVTPRGVLVGTGLVPWSGVSGIAMSDRGALRIGFGGPGHFWYGQKVYTEIADSALERLTTLMPPEIRVQAMQAAVEPSAP